jgi:sugar phosphate isomerase/epimerase
VKDMDEVHDYVAARTRRARADKHLTPEGRQARIAGAWSRANRAAAQMQQGADDANAERFRKLTRTAFIGPSSGPATPDEAISRRDAADRAAQITDPREALEILQRASDHGDEHLAAAVGYHAFQQQQVVNRLTGGKDSGQEWRSVVAAYAADRPAAAEAITELSDLASPNGVNRQLHNAMRYVVPKPAEIENLSDEEINRLASEV